MAPDSVEQGDVGFLWMSEGQNPLVLFWGVPDPAAIGVVADPIIVYLVHWFLSSKWGGAE